jgi:serine/threonine protein kinase
MQVVSTSLTAPVNVKLTDFGFTQVTGTPIYMAPEILEKQAYGKEADVYR